MSERQRLPNRRRCETREILHNGQAYTLSAAFFPGTRFVAEIFLSSHRPGSETESIARDGAILASLALQHGADIETLRHALTRVEDGSAATAIGVALGSRGKMSTTRIIGFS